MEIFLHHFQKKRMSFLSSTFGIYLVSNHFKIPLELATDSNGINSFLRAINLVNIEAILSRYEIGPKGDSEEDLQSMMNFL